MAINYTNCFHFKAPQNLPKLGFLVLEIYHLATLPSSSVVVVGGGGTTKRRIPLQKA
jgi:hypothetical protein